MDIIRNFFETKLHIGASQIGASKAKVIDELTFKGFIKHWKKNGFKNVITMVGAGISTSAGIPDFRSPGTGLYANLKKYNLPYPMAIFDIEYFKRNPQPFFTLAKELYPGNFNPTPTHYFVRLLHEKGLLRRHYTQNIDTLERVAGIPAEKLVEAHGTFYTNHCVGCKKEYPKEWVKEHVFKDTVPKCLKCKSVVKPDIVFFGEELPTIFYNLPAKDFAGCDLLLVMGTSLEVYPFASLLDYTATQTLRVFINRTSVLDLGETHNTRDIVYLGDCDEAIWAICEGLDWTKELKELMSGENEILEKKYAINRRRSTSTSSIVSDTEEKATTSKTQENEDKNVVKTNTDTQK